MKIFVLFLLVALSIVSCEDNEVNEFAMQAMIGDKLYTSSEALASISEDGSLVIQGFQNMESLTLKLSRFKNGNFTLGEDNPNSATYDMDGSLYLTNPNGDGVVNISKIDEANKTLDGTFHFMAILPGIDTVYVSRGVLYNVSYDNGGVINPENAGTFSAKIDGEPFSPRTVLANETNDTITISGSTINARISLTVPSNLQVGGHLLSESGYSAVYQDETGTQVTSQGSISIAEHNPASRSIRGTFSFLTDQSEITEGRFEVVYQ